jgi:hypothetical protein
VDCDNQIRLVKGHNHSDPPAPHQPYETGISVFVGINLDWTRQHPFDIGICDSPSTRSVLRVPRIAHAPLRACEEKFSPSGATDGNRQVTAIDADRRTVAGVVGDGGGENLASDVGLVLARGPDQLGVAA